MRSGADDEMTSGIGGPGADIIKKGPGGGPEADIIKQAPGVRHEGALPLVAAELFVLIDLPKLSTGTPANVPMRGIDPASFGVREEASLVEGRMLRFGTNEVVVERAAARSYAGLRVGSEIKAGQN